MLRRLTGLMLIVAAGSATAGTPFVATLASPTEKSSPILDSVVWRCDSSTCTSNSQLTISPATACHDIAKHIGAVAAFHSQQGEMSAEQLAKCNEGSKSK